MWVQSLWCSANFPPRQTQVFEQEDECILKEIEEARKEYKDDSALQNIIDGIVDLYLSTLYKLKFLA